MTKNKTITSSKENLNGIQKYWLCRRKQIKQKNIETKIINTYYLKNERCIRQIEANRTDIISKKT